MNNNDIELKSKMDLLDQLDQLDQAENNTIGTEPITADLIEPIEPMEYIPTGEGKGEGESINKTNTNMDELVNVNNIEDESDENKENEKIEEETDVRFLAYLQCKSLESHSHAELDKHLTKRHNVVFDKGGYINSDTKMFLAECKSCGAGWNMYKVDDQARGMFGHKIQEKISRVTPYKGFSVHSNLDKTPTSNTNEKGWDKWWDKHSTLSEKIKYQPSYPNAPTTPTTPTTHTTFITPKKEPVKII